MAKIGFSLGSLLSVNDVLRCATILSRHDVDSVWIPETWGMECGSMLSAVARIARKPKIGSSIINIYSRSPSLIAMSAVTLDNLSGGRLILGLGSSSKAIVEDWHGMEFDRPLRRMEEYVEITREIMSGKKVNYDGEFFHLKNFSLLIKPVRKKIPIYLAAINPKMMDLAWKVGDGVILYLRPLPELKNTLSSLQRKRVIDVACQIITSVSQDSEQALIRAKKTIAFYVSVGRTYREFLAKNGYLRETRDIQQEYEKSGLEGTYRYVTDSMAESLAISGTPEEIGKKLRKFIKAGVKVPILQFNPVGDVGKSFRLLVSTLKGESMI